MFVRGTVDPGAPGGLRPRAPSGRPRGRVDPGCRARPRHDPEQRTRPPASSSRGAQDEAPRTLRRLQGWRPSRLRLPLRDDHEAAIRVGVVHLREPGRPAVREELSRCASSAPTPNSRATRYTRRCRTGSTNTSGSPSREPCGRSAKRTRAVSHRCIPSHSPDPHDAPLIRDTGAPSPEMRPRARASSAITSPSDTPVKSR